MLNREKDVFIQTESTPNPATLKFLPECIVMESGTADFPTAKAAARSPLASELFSITGVKGVFFGRDFISVTKSQDFAWDSLKPLIFECLVNYFAAHNIVEVSQPQDLTKSTDSDKDDADSIEVEIKELLDSRVRPAVAMDGGDIIFERFEKGIVFLRLQGACSGCPSSTATLKTGIENMLKYYIPEVTEVRAVS